MTSVSFCFGARPRLVLVCRLLLQIFVLEYDEWSRERAAFVAEMHISTAPSVNENLSCWRSPHVRGIGFRNQGNFCL